MANTALYEIQHFPFAFLCQWPVGKKGPRKQGRDQFFVGAQMACESHKGKCDTNMERKVSSVGRIRFREFNTLTLPMLL